MVPRLPTWRIYMRYLDRRSLIISMECFLHCCDNTHDPIPLPDGKDVVVGRMPELKIQNAKCSRNQVKLTADYENKEVRVKQLGKKPGSIAGKELKHGETAVLGPGGKICLLHEEFPHFIYFKMESNVKSSLQNSNSIAKTSERRNKKRKIEETDEEICEMKKKAKISPMRDSNDKLEHNASASSSSAEKQSKKTVQDIDDNGKQIKTGTPCTISTWEEIPGELLVYTRKGVEGRPKIAGFDMDGTLITTKSGRVFPTNTADWKIALPHIPGKLKNFWNDGYKVVIFTNQNGIAKKKVSIPDFKKKIENVVDALCVPIQVLISPGTGHYRKPSTGMWTHLCDKVNQGIKVVKEQSCYIGDAAGRPVGWAPGKKKDFSCSDRAFASNVGIKFQTPEEFFLNKKAAPFNMPAFDPSKLDPNAPLYTPTTSNLVAKEKEVVIMVGFPASGKSTFCEEHLVPHGYVRVNRDSLGTWQKCVSACRSALAEGKSVVVDNTNADKESRKRFTECAKAAKVPARCFVMDVTIEHARHNNTVRETLNTDTNYKHVGFMVYNMYKSSYKEPSCDEGFTEILRIQFKAKFKDNSTKQLYNQFL